jgi:hypothetical protein
MRPGYRYAREAGLGHTLRELASAKMALVAVCPHCKHQRVLFIASLIERYGENFPVLALRERLRCTSCRARMPNLHESSR